MAGRKAIAITARQFAALRALWDHGPLTAREVLGYLNAGETNPPYTTVLGLLQSMEKVGLVVHEKESQTHRYRPTLTEREATRNLLSDFVGRFFHGSAERLILGLVDAEQIDPEVLRGVEARLAEREAQTKSEGEAMP